MKLLAQYDKQNTAIEHLYSHIFCYRGKMLVVTPDEATTLKAFLGYDEDDDDNGACELIVFSRVVSD